MKQIWHWLNERWPLTALFRLGFEEEIPGGSSCAYTLGSATLIIFILQVITGVWQLFYYVPTIDHAYNSINYLRLSIPFGWLIHGIHFWGAQLMIIAVFLHMIRVFIWGAYKKPREITWLAGTFLFMLTMAMSFTGVLLPWDEKGYFAAEVGTSIVGTIPYIGTWVKNTMRGGPSMGQLTISRFFIMHVAIFPFILMLFLGIHLVAFRRFGIVGPWQESRRRKSGLFWPDQIFKDSFVSVLLFLLLIGLTVFWRAPFTGAANVVDTTYHPKPEWNFLFLYQALKAFKGPWEPFGTVGLPLLGIIILLLFPFTDKNPQRNPLKRPIAMFLMVAGLAINLTLTVTGYLSHPGKVSAPPAKTPSTPMASQKQAPQLSGAALDGQKLFTSVGCVGCHTINGKGGNVGPDLSGEANRGHSRSWLASQIRNPKIHVANSIMPSFKNLTNQQVNDLVDYLLTLGAVGSSGTGNQTPSATPSNTSSTGKSITPKSSLQLAGKVNPGISPAKRPPGPAASIIGNPQHGEALFNRNCESCHGLSGTGNVPNPGSTSGKVPALNPINYTLFNKNAQIFAQNIDRFIQHGATPPGPDPTLKMPDFGDSHTLSQQEISEIESYILYINGVNRAQLQNPGIDPKTFFFFTTLMFAFTLVGLIILQKLNKSSGVGSQKK
jgi:ubiquinol-cytochrome c reductase cytochrome b subunit